MYNDADDEKSAICIYDSISKGKARIWNTYQEKEKHSIYNRTSWQKNELIYYWMLQSISTLRWSMNAQPTPIK